MSMDKNSKKLLSLRNRAGATPGLCDVNIDPSSSDFSQVNFDQYSEFL